MTFQSTPLAGGATNPRHRRQHSYNISIHAPRGRGDTWLFKLFTNRIRFQSTPLAGGATDKIQPLVQLLYISIHAPRGRGDDITDKDQQIATLFQSTPLAGGATRVSYYLFGKDLFQSTPLAGGATKINRRRRVCRAISIHAPRGRGDGAEIPGAKLEQGISIHAPRGRGDEPAVKREVERLISIHAPRGRGDPHPHFTITHFKKFQSTPLAGGATAKQTKPAGEYF